MKSKISFFRVSLSVVKEDFRKFWAIPVLAFIGYFLSGIFYILMNYKNISDGRGTYLASIIESILTGMYPPYSILLAVIPILSVVLIFRYMHSAGPVMTVHSQPFTRNILLNSHALSSVLFSVIPILLTGIILLVIAQPTYYPPEYYDSSADMVNVFARTEVMKWIWESILISLFVISVSLIGTMATGTSLHNALAAVGFNFVIPGCIWLSTFYFDQYLFGYTMSDDFMTKTFYTQPLTASYTMHHFSALLNIIYVIVIIALYAFAMFLYNIRKVERASDGVVFKSFDVAITLVFGYAGMTGLGAIFDSMFGGGNGVIVVFGYIAGGLLSMVVCRMVVMKTIRIFTKESLKIMASYAVLAVVFIAAVVCDITGYENRTPKDADFVEVNITLDSPFSMGDSGPLKDKDDMEMANDLRSFILENEDLCTRWENYHTYAENEYEEHEDYTYVRFNYGKSTDNDEGESICSRYYSVPVWLLFSSDEYKAYLNCETVHENVADALPDEEAMVSAQIVYNAMVNGAEETTTIADKEQAKALRNAIESDIMSMSADDIISDYNKGSLASVNLQFDFNLDGSVKPISDEAEYYNMRAASTRNMNTGQELKDVTKAQTVNLYSYEWIITESYRNTIAWIEANGYGEFLNIRNDMWQFAAIYDIPSGEDNLGDSNISSIPESREGMRVITDAAQIADLYSRSKSHSVYGSIADLSTKDDDVYKICLYRWNEGSGEYYPDYGAYITGDELSEVISRINN